MTWHDTKVSKKDLGMDKDFPMRSFVKKLKDMSGMVISVTAEAERKKNDWNKNDMNDRDIRELIQH